jgi:histidyl-tRNA synthetase
MQALPGFRDFLPDDCAVRNYTFACWREVARRYGFLEWDGPVLKPTELYKKKSGAEIVDQLFNFTDKGEREVAMRPELTPTLARVVAAQEREFKKPLKWFSIGQFFRYEKQQRGRLREHFQLNCDIIGEAALAADIELVALCIDILRAFGFTEKDFVVGLATAISGPISCAKEVYCRTDGMNCCRQSINPDVNRARRQRRNLANSPIQSFQF